MKDKLCFLIPYYNHPQNINFLVNVLLEYNITIILVDDGSNSALKDILNIESSLILIVSHNINKGKGSAIITGINKALEMGFNSCFQIDADAQHDLCKITEFIKCYEEYPASLICAKPLYNKDIPKSRLYGRKITSFWVYINTLGAIKEDSMIGMRIYPLDKINKILKSVKSKRMAFDTDILLSYFKNDIDIKWIDVNITYSNNNVSHFRVVKDNILISLMHARHFLLLPIYLIKKSIRGFFKPRSAENKLLRFAPSSENGLPLIRARPRFSSIAYASRRHFLCLDNLIKKLLYRSK